MTYLVIGASGFIGSHVMASLGRAHPVTGTYFSNSHSWVAQSGLKWLDVRDTKGVHMLLERLRPECLVLVCGTKDIAFCDRSPAEAREAHIQGTAHVIEACKRIGARLAYISSDCVFNGEKPLFSESDAVEPFNEYGRIKRKAEELIESSGLDTIIIRVSLMFGWGKPGQSGNFALLAYNALSSGSPFRAATNLINTPLHIAPAAEAISGLLCAAHQGVFHIGGSDLVCRFRFATSVAEVFGFDASLVEAIVDTSGLRQRNSCLSTVKVRAALQVDLEGLEAGIRRMCSELTVAERSK